MLMVYTEGKQVWFEQQLKLQWLGPLVTLPVSVGGRPSSLQPSWTWECSSRRTALSESPAAETQN